MTAHLTHENLPEADDPEANRLIASMNNPFAFGHPLGYLRLVETHISWILLTGTYAYKIKKPVDFGFLDFSTLERRRYYCEQEIRLNRRFAPQIYLEVVEIRGSETQPHIGGHGEILEYAVKMMEFPQQSLLSNYAARGELDAEIIDAIALTVSKIHAHGDPAERDSDFGSASQVAHWSDENLVHLADARPTEYLPNAFFELRRWYRENDDILDIVEQRRAGGHVRECHGDLHLGNMALIDGQVTLFDCIEFNPDLRWIDTISETAFVAMDLQARGYVEYSWRFLNRYFACSGDYEAAALLRYYVVYRALVRAKVEALRAKQEAGAPGSPGDHLEPAFAYIELANRWAHSHRAGLVLMHGLSGSGKSTVAAQLVEKLGAIQLRSDIERKRLYGFDALETTDSDLDQGIYTATATEATYRRLADLAGQLLLADYTVIIDATFLQQAQRQVLIDLELECDYRTVIVDCQAPEAELRQRIIAREGDASEANLEVLEEQLATRQPIGLRDREQAVCVTLDRTGLDAASIAEIRAALT